MSAGAPGSAVQHESMRLRAHDRLRKRFEFRRVRDLGRRVHTKSFLLLIAADAKDAPSRFGNTVPSRLGNTTPARPNNTAPSRLGITVTRQVANAVGRNRIKRMVREVFRQNRTLFPGATDIVVVAKRACSVQSYGEVRDEMIAASSAIRSAAAKAAGGRR